MNEAMMKMTMHEGDLSEGTRLEGDVAVDTETMGLRHGRDRLCLVQIADEAGSVHLMRVSKEGRAPRLEELLVDEGRVKIFHFARFDVGALWGRYGVETRSLYCTRVASKLARTYTDRHSLRDLCQEFLKVDLSKKMQSSDWGGDLKDAQRSYAASDVVYLHDLRERLDEILEREGRGDLARRCFGAVGVMSRLDVAGFGEGDFFSHGG